MVALDPDRNAVSAEEGYSRTDSPQGNTLARLRGYLASLSPAEKKVAQFVLANPEEVIHMTLAEVATHAQVSDATVVRFCQTIGHDGWLEFKIGLTRAIPHSPQLIHKDLSSADTTATIFRKVIQGSIQALESTQALLDESAVQKGVDLLLGARRILIVGVGTSGPVAHEFFNRLLRLGLNCQVQTDSYLQIMQGALLTPQDVLVVISQTGDSYDPRRTAAEARHSGVPVVCISGNALSPIASFSDVVLLSASQESMPETISSRIAQYALIHALYICLAMRSMDQSIENERLIWENLMRKDPFQHGGS